MIRRLFTIMILLASTVAYADDNSAKQIAAIPTLIAQRNNAMDALAICSGDTAILQAKVTELQKQLDDLRSKPDAK